MRRLLSAVRWDLNFQFKYGFYYAYILVTAMYVIVLRQLPEGALNLVAPFVVFSDPAILGFFFIGGLVLLEKGEGTLEYLVATPLRIWEYLVSKMISLTVLAALAGLAISLLGYGRGFNGILLAVGILLTSFLFILIGFIAVARFRTVNEYIMTSILYMMVLNIPVLDFFGIVETPLFYIFPAQASLILMKASFNPMEAWKIIYAVACLMFWIMIAWRFGYRSFYRFMVLKEGVK